MALAYSGEEGYLEHKLVFPCSLPLTGCSLPLTGCPLYPRAQGGLLALSLPQFQRRSPAWLSLPLPGPQPCTSFTPRIPCPSGPAKTFWTPTSGRGIPARQSFHHRCIYWQKLFPSIEGKGASRVGDFFPLSQQCSRGRRGAGRWAGTSQSESQYQQLTFIELFH